jgi:hypothetical protein
MQKPGEPAKAQSPALMVVMVVILLAALAGLLWWWPRTGPAGMRGVGEVVAEPVAGSSPAGGAEAVRETRARQATRQEKPVLPSFPTSDAVRIGMPKSELLEKFGRPNMITTAVELGEVMETLVYIQRGTTTTETVVVLKNGAVVSVSSNKR